MDNLHIKLDPANKEVIVREGQAPAVYEYKGFQYNLDSVPSIIELINWKGSQLNSVIFVDEKQVHVILDDTVQNRTKDTGTCVFKESLEFQEWRRVLGNFLNQKDFLDFLKRRPDGEIEIIDSLKAAVQIFKVNCQITGEFNHDDSNNVQVMFKMGEIESSIRLPKMFLVQMPLIYGSDTIMDMEVELEFTVPKAENEKPTFRLTIPKFQRYWQEAIKAELAKLKEALPGHLILDGRSK